eukprot:CAMPEP_0115740332 /NCGR_PEP_ID=MMETSP0272-20121206/89428_1 /TAXON_ID=71861 /ORGANISM="Scrippsiella trochoidea, Strain CCMP3099" /LENGTH=144 /DNA_ID=CAMNT_0003184961 /DNA_START=81 /DNA_END=512 /DNA_ORIENTATION=+
MRDPISRAVSAFNWRSPLNNPAQHSFAKGEKPLYDCFRTADEFAVGLGRNDTCGTIARNAVYITPVSHIGKSLSWYLADAMPCLARRAFYLVRTETFQADIEKLSRCLKLKKPRNKLVFDKAHYPMKTKTELSSEGFRNFYNAY